MRPSLIRKLHHRTTTPNMGCSSGRCLEINGGKEKDGGASWRDKTETAPTLESPLQRKDGEMNYRRRGEGDSSGCPRMWRRRILASS